MSEVKTTPTPPANPEPAKESPNKPVVGNSEPTLKQLIDLASLKIKKIKMFQLGNVETGDIEKGISNVQPRFVGKPGHNPYLYLAQNTEPVERAIEDGSVTTEQLNALLKLPDEVVPDGKAIKPVNIMLRDQLRKLSMPTR